MLLVIVCKLHCFIAFEKHYRIYLLHTTNMNRHAHLHICWTTRVVIASEKLWNRECGKEGKQNVRRSWKKRTFDNNLQLHKYAIHFVKLIKIIGYRIFSLSRGIEVEILINCIKRKPPKEHQIVHYLFSVSAKYESWPTFGVREVLRQLLVDIFFFFLAYFHWVKLIFTYVFNCFVVAQKKREKRSGCFYILVNKVLIVLNSFVNTLTLVEKVKVIYWLFIGWSKLKCFCVAHKMIQIKSSRKMNQ